MSPAVSLAVSLAVGGLQQFGWHSMILLTPSHQSALAWLHVFVLDRRQQVVVVSKALGSGGGRFHGMDRACTEDRCFLFVFWLDLIDLCVNVHPR